METKEKRIIFSLFSNSVSITGTDINFYNEKWTVYYAQRIICVTQIYANLHSKSLSNSYLVKKVQFSWKKKKIFLNMLQQNLVLEY